MFLATAADCGGGLVIPAQIVSVIQMIVTLIKIGVPILLIVFGMLDLGKSVMAQKEDEIKKGQQLFIKRLISAAIVFFVVTIVQFIVGLLDTPTGYVNASGQTITVEAYDSLRDEQKEAYTAQSNCFNKILNNK